MPIYNHFYPDQNQQIGTPQSIQNLFIQGPLLPVVVSLPPAYIQLLQQQGQPVPAPVPGLALVDTGATLCAVDQSLVAAFGIPPSGYEMIQGANLGSPTFQLTYPASLSFPGTTLPNISFANFVGLPLSSGGIVAVIGRSVLKQFILVYNGPGGFITLSY